MSGPPPWLRGRLERAVERLDRHPDPAAAVRAVARRHERDEAEVLLTAGSSGAFALLQRVLRPQRPVVVGTARWGVAALALAPPYDLDPGQVPDDADVVVVGNPCAPAGLRPQRLPGLVRDGRTVVVDEPYGDLVPGSFGDRGDLVVVRSLSRTWGIAGLRAGYVLGPPDLVAALRDEQPPWPVSSLALVALETCLARGPVRAAEAAGAQARERLTAVLQEAGAQVLPGSQAPYVLCRGTVPPDLGAEPVGPDLWRVEA